MEGDVVHREYHDIFGVGGGADTMATEREVVPVDLLVLV
jgi:hypothetical protein